MKNALLFGNGLNQVTRDGPSWDYLLEQLKGSKSFKHSSLTNTKNSGASLLNYF